MWLSTVRAQKRDMMCHCSLVFPEIGSPAAVLSPCTDCGQLAEQLSVGSLIYKTEETAADTTVCLAHWVSSIANAADHHAEASYHDKAMGANCWAA